MKVYQPQLSFKGGRRYVHGTTIYENILMGCEEVGFGQPDGNLQIDLRSMLTEQADFQYVVDGESATKLSESVCDFTLSIEGRRVRGWIVPNGKPINDSLPYDEDEILSCADFANNTATLAKVPPSSPIEISTCLVVRLHQIVYPPPSDMKWLLARAKFQRPMTSDDMPTLSLSLRRKVGDHFTETGISVSDRDFGSFGFFLASVPKL